MGPVIKAISGVFSTPKMPKIEKPEAVIAPVSSEATALAARKRLQERAQKGREGTIYSPSYSNSALGGTS